MVADMDKPYGTPAPPSTSDTPRDTINVRGTNAWVDDTTAPAVVVLALMTTDGNWIQVRFSAREAGHVSDHLAILVRDLP